ncbi:MAG: DsbA family protein [Pseudomonadota bacterium]|jgi:protein-disulfide isomerase|uniref:DsbA family protein n=1 Tax=Pseudooceanicola nitratireducens TaxID=517719 RepID=UPI002EB7F5CF|nr:DsbA family protein [Pseudomonadota bacterium]
MKPVLNKRYFLFGLAAAGAVAAYPTAKSIKEALTPLPELEPMADPAGFRKANVGPSSSGFNPLVGVGEPNDAPALPIEETRLTICESLFPEATANPGVVPIASFADYYCPFCRIQTKNLAALSTQLAGRVSMHWHELPLLGETSMLAARAALAAKKQGAYVAFQERLMSSPFQATEAYLEALSTSIGVDHAKLASDMNSEAIRAEIQTSSALAQIFGFIGTPALVVGRTVIQGQISNAALKKIVEIERSEGWNQAC